MTRVNIACRHLLQANKGMSGTEGSHWGQVEAGKGEEKGGGIGGDAMCEV